ncbi:MAG TPA: S9 family peptidase, partial [Longimicrobiales bacterium]|nr:S9 family peptidase [Longimicrobiales bacterium]
MTRLRTAFLAVLAIMCTALPLTAQGQSASRTITLEDMLRLPEFGSYELSPDGRQVLFTRSDRDTVAYEETSHIHLHDLATGRTIQLTNSEKGESRPGWLPDGRVTFRSDRGDGNEMWVISPTGGEAQRYVEDEDAEDGEFSPDYTRIAFTESTDRPDEEEWEERVERKDDGYFAERKLTYEHLWVYDVAAGKKTQLTTGDFDHGSPTWSPDGRSIAYVSNRSNTTARDPGYSNNSDIYLVPADSGAARQLTTNPGPDRSPDFSPDGRLMAYLSSDRVNNSADQNDVKVLALDGGAPVNLTADYDYSVSSVEWSKDGSHLYISAAEGLTQKLYKVPAQGGELTPIEFDDGVVFRDFSQSEDGSKWLVTGSTLSEPDLVYLTDPDGRNPQRILEEHNLLADFRVARAEPLTWKGADGWDIEGVLHYPLDYQPGVRYPLILQVHGGPHGRYTESFNQGAQIWAARGYAVLQTNPRGSSGRTFEFSNANVNDWGGKDFTDIMNGVDHVIELGVADPERMAVIGGSDGGFMTFWAVT